MSVNKVILVGRLGQNPEVRYTPSGAAVANFSVATNESWTDKSGQRQERTEWHKVVVWGKLAELCNQFLAKGRQVYLEGRLQTRQWQDKDGQTKYTTEIQAQTVQFLGGGPNDRVGNPGMDHAGMGAAMGGGMEAGMGRDQDSGYGHSAGGAGYQGNAAPRSAVPRPVANNRSNSFGSAGPAEEPSFTEDDIPF